jgi:hypothetical protein
MRVLFSSLVRRLRRCPALRRPYVADLEFVAARTFAAHEVREIYRLSLPENSFLRNYVGQRANLHVDIISHGPQSDGSWP